MRTIWMLTMLAACDDGGFSAPADAPAPPRETVTASRTLLVGEIAEAILVGGPGDSATIRVTAPVPKLDWNIHGHAGGATQTVVEELAVMSIDYAFAPTAQADWYLLLRNRDTAQMPLEVTIDLYGDITWSGWE